MSLTTDPNDPRLKRGTTDEQGQHAVYLVMTEEERKKGFVRPVRGSYTHVGLPAPRYQLRDLTEEETARYAEYGYVKYETYSEADAPLCGKFWTQKELSAVNNGCGGTTSMPQAIAETYARDPSYYGATFCVACNRHIRVAEFVWAGTDLRVGS